MSNELDDARFDRLIGSVDPALIVVTTTEGDERGGCLVGFHTQSSIDPRRYSIWLSKANHTYRLGLRASHFGIHFLAADQSTLAERFGTLSGDDVDKFGGLPIEVGPNDLPLLADVSNRVVARRVAILDEGGDHVCITIEPISVETSGPFEPLRLSAATHLVPGHDNTERHDPPTERAAD